ncbi:MAG: hypothetical protein SVS15_01175 [Thermodesulfobacteriota bacterium]|nr:hypothetical protein [Thermodesulfobacteriota bacterium]
MPALPCTSTQRAFQDGLKTYVRAARKDSAGPSAFQIPLDARARKRSFGFSFGKFSLDYTSQDLELDPKKISEQKRSQDAWTPRSTLEHGTPLQSFSPGQNPKENAAREPSALDVRLGLLAYAEAVSGLDPISMPRRLRGVI